MRNLKIALILLVSSFAFDTPVCAQVAPLSEYELKPAYSDEFTSTTLKSSLWNKCLDYYSGNPCIRVTQEGTNFDPARVTVGNSSPSDPTNTSGFLRITPFIDFNQRHDEPYTKIANFPYYYSGHVITPQRFRYGYYETRVKLPYSPTNNFNGISSWWATGGCEATVFDNGKYNETDIFETFEWDKIMPNLLLGHGTDIDEKGREIRNCTFGTEYSFNNVAGFYRNDVPNGQNLSTDFHTIGFEWMPSYVNLYFDGQLYARVPHLKWNIGKTPTNKINGQDIVDINVWDVPQRFIYWIKRWDYINYGEDIKTQARDLTGTRDNPVNNDRFLEVDYFRYHKRKPSIYSSTYNNSSNQLLLKATTDINDDNYAWSVINGGNFSIINQAGSECTIQINPGFIGGSVSVTANGLWPTTSSSRDYELNYLSSGILCSIANDNSIYFGSTITTCIDFNIPQNNRLTLVAENEIIFETGFNVELGATLEAFTR